MVHTKQDMKRKKHGHVCTTSNLGLTFEKPPPNRSEACPGGISQGHKTVHFTCNVAPCMSFAPQSHKSQLKHPTLGPEIPLKVVALFKKTLVQMVQICPLQSKKRCFSQTVFLKNMFGAQ